MDARGCTWRSRGVRGVSCWGVCEGSRVRGNVSWGCIFLGRRGLFLMKKMHHDDVTQPHLSFEALY